MLLLRKSLTCRLSPLNPAFTSSIYRLLSTPPSTPSPTSDFAAQYLINSCGLPSDKAARASRYLPRLKSPEKFDAVLAFLRKAGVSEPHIIAAVSREPRLLGLSVEKCLKPKMAELQQMGFSPSDISFLLSVSPGAFLRTTFLQNIKFWLRIVISIEKLLRILKNDFFFLTINPKIYSANVSFLQEQCSLSVRQIGQLITSAPESVRWKPQVLEFNVKRVEELGIPCSSGMFVYALMVVSRMKHSAIDARLHHLKSLGFSQDEVTLLISKAPTVLQKSEKLISHRMRFLTNCAGCEKLHVVRNPALLMYNLEKRLIPRNLVRELLKSNEVPVANKKFITFAKLKENEFLEKFVVPFEKNIPGLHQAYSDACSGKHQLMNSSRAPQFVCLIV